MTLIFWQSDKAKKNVNLIFCKLKKLKNMNFIIFKIKKCQKMWIQFFASLEKRKNMNLIFFFKLKNLKKHEFRLFCRDWMNLMTVTHITKNASHGVSFILHEKAQSLQIHTCRFKKKGEINYLSSSYRAVDELKGERRQNTNFLQNYVPRMNVIQKVLKSRRSELSKTVSTVEKN